MEFAEGDLVLLNARNLARAGPGAKLQPRFVGPFAVEKRVGKVAYRLTLPPDYRIHPVFHVSLLKKHVGGMSALPPTPTADKEGAEVEAGRAGYYIAQDVVGHRDRTPTDVPRSKKGKQPRPQREYLVRWQGHRPEDDTWEPARKLKRTEDLQAMVRAYCERNGVAVRW